MLHRVIAIRKIDYVIRMANSVQILQKTHIPLNQGNINHSEWHDKPMRDKSAPITVGRIKYRPESNAHEIAESAENFTLNLFATLNNVIYFPYEHRTS